MYIKNENLENYVLDYKEKINRFVSNVFLVLYKYFYWIKIKIVRYLEEKIYMLTDGTQIKITVKIPLKLIYK